MMDAGELARCLGNHAEAVCRYYLSAGHREGRYWLVGDVRNTPGRSMFVRLYDSAKGPAGKWTDASSFEHGDLLDVIRESCGLIDFKDVTDEAKTFLSLPHEELESTSRYRAPSAPSGSREAARRLFAMSRPLGGSVVETYLRNRGITFLHGTRSLRFHPRCYYRPDEHGPTETWPAIIAAVTGGLDFNDHQLIWAKLDKVHAKHPDMVLLHGGSPKGAERIAAAWADNRKVPQIAFRPDWAKHAKAAPFKRNDALLAVLPVGVIVFPGNGIQDNLADKARALGIPVWRFGNGGA